MLFGVYSTCHMVNRLKIPQGFSTLLFHQWSEVPSRGEFCGDSIHHTKNYLLYKDATCHNLWPCDFTDVTAFSFLFFLALHYCFFLSMFYLLWVFSLKFFSWLWCSFSRAPFFPDCCFFWLFLWPLLPTSSWWLFVSTP